MFRFTKNKETGQLVVKAPNPCMSWLQERQSKSFDNYVYLYNPTSASFPLQRPGLAVRIIEIQPNESLVTFEVNKPLRRNVPALVTSMQLAHWEGERGYSRYVVDAEMPMPFGIRLTIYSQPDSDQLVARLSQEPLRNSVF